MQPCSDLWLFDPVIAQAGRRPCPLGGWSGQAGSGLA